MNSESGIPGLGPLPKSDDNAALQRASFKALYSLLQHQDDIVLRDERIEDYGVDATFELKVRGCMTNFRAQVQLKGTGSASPNKDGNVSLSVRTANLNYLLNGTSPIYLLFDAGRSEFWYVWAHDELRRLQAANPGWREQDSVTLRFTEHFTLAGLASIIKRALDEGQMNRRIRDSLARSTTSDPIVVRIDAASLDVTDPIQAQHILLASGRAIVAAGFPAEALRLLDLVDLRTKNLPRLQFVAGYAEYMLGKHYVALGHIRQAMVRAQELSKQENDFLGSLKDTCEFRVGLIDATTYLHRADQRAKSLEGVWALRERLETLCHRFLSERDEAVHSALTEEARRITDEILEDSGASEATKLGARLMLLYIEGANATSASAHQLGLLWMREHILVSQTGDMLRGYQRVNSQLAQWEKSANAALKDANTLRHPFLIAEASLVWLGVHVRQLVSQRIDALYREKPFRVPQTAVSRMRQVMADAAAIYERTQSVEGRLRLGMLNADFLEILGDLSGARELAARIYPEAEAMGFYDIAERARELLESRTLLMEFEKEDSRLRQGDDDIWFADMSDQDLRRFARDALQSFGLPPERLRVVEQYCGTLRDKAQARCRWCRHLEVLEDKSQTRDPVTAFRVLPNRQCKCLKFGHETRIPTPDVLALTGAFKNTYCLGCKDRSPLQGSAGRAGG